MATLKQSTAYTRMFLMVLSSDHITGATGLTVTLTLSKAGGAFAAAGGAVTEVSSGWYKVALNTTDTGTLGDLAYHATGTAADPSDFVDQVTTVILGDTFNANVVSMAAGTVTAAAIATDAIDSDAIAASAVTEIQSGLATSAALATVQADTDDIQTRLPATLVGGRMDSSVGAMATGVVTAAAVATGAIDADALATDAVAEIADGVWDEAIAGHLAAGSTGKALSDASAGGDPTIFADALLNRDMSAVSDTNARSPLNALRFLRNKWCITGTTLTVTKENDTTTAWTSALTGTAGADPVTCSDPA